MGMTSRLLSRYPFYALLFPLFFVLHGFAQYYHFIPLAAIGTLALRYVLYLFVLEGIFFLIYRHFIKATTAVFVSFFFFCFFGAFHDIVRQLSGNTFLGRYTFLLPLLSIVYILLLIVIRRKHINSRFILYLNVVLLVLILVDIVTILVNVAKKKERTAEVTNCVACPKPDVHFIVIDGYAGKEQLAKDFSSSNTAFLDSLKHLGFLVLEKSRSNYVRTEFSMASLLNMDYHQLPDYAVTEESLFYCYRQIAKNKVVHAFKEQGYEIINNSIFDIDGHKAPVRNTFLVTGAELIENETLLARLRRDVYIPFLIKYLRHSSFYKDYVFQPYESDKKLASRLENIVSKNNNKPRFVYTHFLMTHFPYFFQANGQLNKTEDIRPDNYENKTLYLGNLHHTNTRILAIIKKLLQASAEPPVIVLVSDHGFRYSANPHQAFSTLGAVYLPSRQYGQYYDSLSGVNQFRVLLNTLFQQRLLLLEDRNGEVPATDQSE
jgi:hypothetical protein